MVRDPVAVHLPCESEEYGNSAAAGRAREGAEIAVVLHLPEAGRGEDDVSGGIVRPEVLGPAERKPSPIAHIHEEDSVRAADAPVELP